MHTAKALERTATVAVERTRTHVGGSFGTLLWVFTVMSVLGLAGETIQHWAAFGEWESRPGFIWGPFSPIYGLAAVLMTVFLEPLQDRNPGLLVVIGGVIGGGLEYFASWAMETYWGVVAWSYLAWPFNFDGRTDLFHCLVWGTLAAIWVKVGLPLAQKAFDNVNLKGRLYRGLTVGLAIFTALNIVVTCTVLMRADARADQVPAQNAIEQIYDVAYPTDMLQKRFHNMGGLGI